MTAAEPRWWFRARGTLPTQDYSWTDLRGCKAPEAGTTAKPAEALSMSGATTIALGNWVDDNNRPFSVYIDGITSETWPLDAVGRPIELTVMGLADSIGSEQQLLAALNSLATMPRQDLVKSLLNFGASSDLGWTIDTTEWSKLLSGPELGREIAQIETSSQLPWGKRDRTEYFVDEATRSRSEVRSGDEGPQSKWTLVVSNLIDDDWCLRHKPYRAAGDLLSGLSPDVLEGIAAKAREAENGKKDRRRSTAVSIVLLVLLATGLLLVLIR